MYKFHHKKETNSYQKPVAVVLSCVGGEGGDLGVVRSLGRHDVPTHVLSENHQQLVLWSKYCHSYDVLHNFSMNIQETVTYLMNFSKNLPEKPVIYPTTDPDLNLLIEHRDELTDYYKFTIPKKEIAQDFLSKKRFFEVAKHYNVPVPKTFFPQNREDIDHIINELEFPVVLKPVYPPDWRGNPQIMAIAHDKKVIIAQKPSELVEYYQRISPYNSAFVVQEYIEGGDDEHFDMHVYMNSEVEPLACFTGRKIRVYPAFAGSGCFVRSMHVPEIISIGMDILKKVGFSGIANFNFKRDTHKNEFKLLEINPRISSWNIFAEQCGVNIPYMAYLDAIGVQTRTVSPQKENISFVYIEKDLKAFLEYRKKRVWNFWTWVLSLRGVRVFQIYSPDDRRPFVIKLCRSMVYRIKCFLNKFHLLQVKKEMAAVLAITIDLFYTTMQDIF
jgi:predicted ATP-grasp superfamily ATP-dependent carboligase